MLQLRFHPEFRIAPPAWPPQLSERLTTAIETATRAAADAARAAEAAAQAQEAAAKRQSEAPPVPDLRPKLQEELKLLADTATGLWRIRRNLVPKGPGRLLEKRPVQGMESPFKWVVSTWDMLKEEYGLEIQDHNGDRYISGQAIKAHFEAAPDLHEDTILDTIKPTIYFDGKPIQMGEVVVGTPDLAETTPASPTSSAAPARPAPQGKSYFAT
jgi:hypothetical protein